MPDDKQGASATNSPPLEIPPPAETGGFVARELSRIAVRLRELGIPSAQYEQLYAAQQALAWALEPMGFGTPYDVIVGTRGGSADCSAHIHPQSS